jgi:pimeloyl-ACP methyl ester carboxylesterase
MSKPEIGKVRSADGTEIAYQRDGQGPALVFVDGAFCTRTMGPGNTLAPVLREQFTTFIYDRRGRGDSGDTSTYEPRREIEDFAAVIDVAGASAFVFAHSSGAVLAREGARAGLSIAGLVVYEPPLVVDDSRPSVAPDLPERIARLAADGRSRAVVRTFMTEAIRAPKPLAVVMSVMPGGGRLRAISHTVAHDVTLMSPYQQGTMSPHELCSSVQTPTLVIVGGKSPRWMQNGCEMVAASVPNARLARLDGQSHMVKAKATGPVVSAFLAEGSSRRFGANALITLDRTGTTPASTDAE